MVFFLLLFFLLVSPSYSQIPLIHQLISAYHPSSISFRSPVSVLNSPAPAVLGTKITAPSPLITPIPINVGGEGQIIKIAVLGDSMIDTLQPGLPQLQSALQKYYPNVKFLITNNGTGGQNIENGLYRLLNSYEYLGQKYPSVISQKPDIIIVESFAYNNFGNSSSGIDRQWLALGAITTNIKEKLPSTKIVLAATIAPNSVIFGNGVPGTNFSSLEKIEKSSTIKLYLQNLVNFATSEHYPLANAYHPSLISGEGNKNLINAQDNLHPSGPGGQFFCDTVAKTIFDNQLI